MNWHILYNYSGYTYVSSTTTLCAKYTTPKAQIVLAMHKGANIKAKKILAKVRYSFLCALQIANNVGEWVVRMDNESGSCCLGTFSGKYCKYLRRVDG